MQIDIDFEVFKALTALRESEADSYNSVIRRLLNLPQPNALTPPTTHPVRRGLFGSSSRRAAAPNALMPDTAANSLLEKYLGGVWFGNIHFPEGTKFRATYKGKTYFAEVKDGAWLGSDGVVRRSPSDAAGAISGTNVNGWRFWHAQLPNDPRWRRLDELK